MIFAVKNLVLILIIAGLAFAIFHTRAENPEKLLNGFIKESDIDPRQMYDETLVNSFSAEPDWNPGPQNNTAAQPVIAAKAGILVEINSGDILFDSNSTEKLPIASLAKIMTAVVALEHRGLQDKIFVASDAATVGENTMGVSYGETYSLEELLYGLILHSGNDAAYAIADGVAGNSERFVEWMNFKAEELGLADTHFADPSGLDDENVNTAKDLVKLTRYALKNPTFKEIAATVEKEIFADNFHKYIYLFNQTNLLTTYPGVAGVKTGFTEAAGLCLVTYAENDGREVVGVVLDSIDRKGDMILMLDHGFRTLGVNVEHNLL